MGEGPTSEEKKKRERRKEKKRKKGKQNHRWHLDHRILY